MSPLNNSAFPLFFFKFKALKKQFSTESFAFKCLCIYLFFEYFRPQSIYPALDVLPWAQLFLILAMLFAPLDKQARFQFTGVHFWLLIWTLVLYSSFLVAFDVSWSVDKQINFIQWVVIFFVITSLTTTRERVYLLLIVFLVCSFKIAFGTTRIWVSRGFSFTTWGLAGPPGYFQNSGELAILMLSMFPIAYYLWANFRHELGRWEKLFLSLMVICPLMTILGSSSRGGQLALVCVLSVMFYRRIFRPKVLISLAVVVALGFAVLPEQQKARFSEIGNDKNSQQRILYWQNGLEMIKQHPWLGVGYYNYIPYFNAHYPEDIAYRRKSAELSHNIFIQVGTDAGLIGLSVFIILLCYSLFKRAPDVKHYPLEHSIMKGLRMGTLGFLLAGQFVTVTYYPFLWMNLAFQCAIALSCQIPRNAMQRLGTSFMPNSHANNSKLLMKEGLRE